MIKSIFGLNTEDLRKREAVENQELAEMLSKSTGDNYGVTAFGTAFGREAGKGLLSKMGYEDPEMAQAEANEARQKQLQEDLSKLDSSSPEYFYKFAESIKDIDPVKAGQLAVIGNSIRDKKATAAAKANKKDNFVPTVPNDNLLDLARNEIMADKELRFTGNVTGLDDYELNNYAADVSSRATRMISNLEKRAKKEGVEVNLPNFNTVVRSLIDRDKGERDDEGRQVNDNNKITLEVDRPWYGKADTDFSYNPNN